MRSTIDLSTSQNRALELVTEVAKEKACHPFLVGGPVRDLLLGRNAIDVDLTLEEGSSTLARAIAKRIDGRVRSFPQFLTYKVTAEGLPEIDIATARKERYRTPGSLPAVSPGKLRDDLLRRDFSINAIAIDLINGSLHDPTSGERDLKERVIRILHERSFLDDPTRIFRAIRLASRLGFSIEPETISRMGEAIAAGALESVSKERLWRELFLAMDEHNAPPILIALSQQGALSPTIGSTLTREGEQTLERVRTAIETRPDLDRYVLFTGALLRGLDATANQLEGSGFSQKRARSVLQIARELPRFEDALSGAQSDRHRFRLLKSMSPEMRTIVSTEHPEQAAHLDRYEDFQRFKLALRGNDLEVPAGPHIARALERTREAVFAGEIPPDQARDFAKDLAVRYLKD
ncbi:MAG: CCA tRNA nucleotidyltransferase [Thermoanaerobaculia bacterium]